MGITKQEIFEHFLTSTVPTEEMWSDVELVMEVVYSILPLYQEEITDYNNLLRDKTIIAFGFSYNQKHFLKRHIVSYGGNFRFTKNGNENFFIVHSGTWLYDMLYALKKAREEGAIIITYAHFVKNLGETYSEDAEELIKAEERRIEKIKPKSGPIYKPCSEDVLAQIPTVSMNDISLEDDVFHVIGRIECDFWDNKKGNYRSFNKQTDVYDFISEKGGLLIKKESDNITCVIFGKEPAEDAIMNYAEKVKLIDADSFIDWLKDQSTINKKCREFSKKYAASVDTVLRPYQQFSKREIFKKWNSFFNVMLQLPTGTGKTVLFTSIIRDLTEVKDTKILILAHRKELIDQISEHLNLYDVDHGIISSGRKRSLEKLVQVASVQTLTHDNNIELLDELKPKFIIIDEAHHSLAESYTKFWKKCGDCWKLGVTATPYRLNNKSFRSHFDALVQSMEIDDFISQGYLAKYDYMVDNPQSSLSQTIKSIKERSSTGDYKTATLLKELNVPQHIQRLIVCYEQYVKGQKGIVYAINKEHAHNICDAYKLIGVEAVYIDSDTSKTERSEIVEKFKSGEVEVMVNVDIFSEGFDCPDVEFIQLARPTWSLAKYLQQVGRGLRPCRDKQETVILDNSRMFVKFGLPSEGRMWQWHFNGDPLVKNEYKQENEEYERQLNLVCSFSNEMMVKIDHETAKMAEELVMQDKISQKAQKSVEKEGMPTFKQEVEEDYSSSNENLMVPLTSLKKDKVLESIETADVQKQNQRKMRQEDNEQIKSKMKVEKERKRRKNEAFLQSQVELEKENEKRVQRKNTWIALGYIVAASVALFIIYETGLLIPLGIIGLIIGFLLK